MRVERREVAQTRMATGENALKRGLSFLPIEKVCCQQHVYLYLHLFSDLTGLDLSFLVPFSENEHLWQ